MKTSRSPLKTGLVYGAAILCVAASLPLVLLAILLARTVIATAGAAVLVGGTVAYCASPRWRDWFRDQLGPQGPTAVQSKAAVRRPVTPSGIFSAEAA